MRVIETHPNRKVDIRGADNHQISSIPLVTAGGVTATITSKVIVIMHQCECHGKNKAIHSSPQIENYKNIVEDLSINTLDKHKKPAYIRG